MTQQLMAADECPLVQGAKQPSIDPAAVQLSPAQSQAVSVAVQCLVTAGAVALYLAPLRSVDLDAMTGFGLVSVLPVSTMAGLGMLVIAFIGTLSMRRRCS